MAGSLLNGFEGFYKINIIIGFLKKPQVLTGSYCSGPVFINQKHFPWW